MKITILGTGAWGTALGCCLSLNKHEVVMWGIDENEINDINHNYNKKYFGNEKLFAPLKATNDLHEAISSSDYVLIAIPSVFIVDVLKKVTIILQEEKIKPIFINVAKGLDSFTSDVWSKSIKKILKGFHSGITSLIGPSFAIDVFEKKPTIVNVASKKIETAKNVSELFNSSFFKAVPIDDEIGAQILSAIKNLLAIAIGIAEENHNSINTISALLTVGVNEMQLIAKVMGAKEKTILQYCGIGDIFLTCTCDKSRNFSFGKQVYKNGIYKSLEQNKSTVEGYKVYPTVNELIKNNKIKAPLFTLICKVLSGDLSAKLFVEKALDEIMKLAKDDADKKVKK